MSGGVGRILAALRRAVLWAAGGLITLILAAIFVLAVLAVIDSGPDTRTAAHVTIYLKSPLLTEGGAVIVAGRTLPEAAWRSLASGPNPAAADPENPKRLGVKPGDRHFGVEATSPVTVVEFFYPESGTYTFNFRLAESERTAGTDPEHFRTERVSVGSASLMTDPEGGALVEWPSMSVVAVHGPGRDAGWARLASSTFSNAYGEPLAVTHYEGARTIALSEAQIRAHVKDVVTDEPAPAEAHEDARGDTGSEAEPSRMR